jgi:hypothetical protein
MSSDWKRSVWPKWKPTDLDGELVFNRFLGQSAELDLLQELLVESAPRWCRRLRVQFEPRDQKPIDTSDPHALASAVLETAAERGETYRALVEKHGRGPYERFAGSAELRGAGPELTVVVSLDEMVLAPLGDHVTLNNGVTLQVRRPKAEGRPGAAWLRDTMRTWCERLSPVWGCAHQSAEYEAKVMTDDPDMIVAVGRDFSSHLPGLFWWNYFGTPYRRLLGDERLRSSPGEQVSVVGDGVMVQLSDDPGEWDTPDYAATEQRVRDHLGTELFFSKAAPDRRGVVPDWKV